MSSFIIRQAKRKPLLSCAIRTGRFDMAAMLKPRHQRPAAEGPGRADAPASENIGRIVNAKVDAADAYEDRQKGRQDNEIHTNLG